MPSFSLLYPRLLGCALLVGATTLVCGLSSSASGPAHASPDSKLDELIRQLGDPTFENREAASSELLKRGESAYKQLQRVVRESPDAEVRRRAKDIIDSFDRKRRLASGLHVVGLYQAGAHQHFRLLAPFGRDIDWGRFCAALVEQGKKEAHSPGKRIWQLLPKRAHEIVDNKDLVSRIDAHVKGLTNSAKSDAAARRALGALSQELEEALRRPDFYHNESFQKVTLDKNAKLLLNRRKQLSPLELQLLNRRLLEASFPNMVKNSSFDLKKATVPVRVAATKEPITLVLCSYESIRWHVQTDEGAKLARVIVGGYHLQDVTGTTAPITYHVYKQPANPPRDPHYFYAFEQDQTNYPKMADALRRLTGKEIATFQGRYSYERGRPFVVGVKQ